MLYKKHKGKGTVTDASTSTPKPRETFRRKVIFVGEHQVGKTSLIYNLRTGTRISQYMSSILVGIILGVNSPTRLPTEENGFFTTKLPKGEKGKEDEWPPTELKENDIELELDCWDTSAGDIYFKLRTLQSIDLIAICAAVDDKKSLKAVAERWHPALAYFLPRVPIVLIGCKSDTRVPSTERPHDCEKEGFTIEEGKAMARQVGARGYIEYDVETCVTRGALTDVLTYYAFETWMPPKPKKKSWFVNNFIPLVK